MGELSTFKPGLESLRGIAALIVALNHGQSAMAIPDSAPKAFDWIVYYLNPGSAVVVFFVLSGYVLGISFSKHTIYVDYAIRRMLRIIPAFVVSVLLAAIVLSFVRIDPPPVAASFFFQSAFWPAPTWADLWRNLLFVDFRINGPTWSIWPELVGSLFIPVVFVVHSRLDSSFSWFVCALVLAALVASPYCRYLIFFYAGFFAVPRVAALIVDRPWLRNATLALGVLILAWFGNGNSSYSLKTIMPPAIGAVLAIAAIASGRYQILESRALRYLGRNSYSFYLLHWPVFYLCGLSILAIPSIVPAGFIGNILIMIASTGIAAVLADLSYRLIERPFMDVGRSVVRRSI